MKILVTDFDGTLYPDAYEQNIKAINDFVQEGNKFIIATGRNLESLLKRIANSDIKYSYLICNSGTVIYNNNLEQIHKVSLNIELVKDIYDFFKEDKNITDVFVSDGHTLLTDFDTNITTIVGRYNKKRKAFKTLREIEKKFSNVQGYVSTNWVIIHSKDADKGKAIQYLVTKEKIDENQVFTVGNSFNDIPMNKLYHGYAMKKSVRLLKKNSIGQVTSIAKLIEIIKQKY